MGITSASYKYLRKSPCETKEGALRAGFEKKRGYQVFLLAAENFGAMAIKSFSRNFWLFRFCFFVL
jgi:hypothetical protein